MIIGIDTSAYTTSVALVSDGKIIADHRKPLPVKEGERGLRQSDAVFAHLRNLREMTEYSISDLTPKAIGYSSQPVNRPNSYMPVFKVGETIALFLSRSLNIPAYEFSHQEGHIGAALIGNPYPQSPFITVHISGGTTEVLRVIPGENLDIRLLTASKDLHAGQLIDRVGVAMGAAFPAGAEMDLWAQNAQNRDLRLPGSSIAQGLHFSGPESAAYRLIQEGVKKEDLAYAVFIVIARALEKLILAASHETGIEKIIMVGGVARNSIIRKELLQRMKLELQFCPAALCSDNAVGIAYLTEKKFKERD